MPARAPAAMPPQRTSAALRALTAAATALAMARCLGSQAFERSTAPGPPGLRLGAFALTGLHQGCVGGARWGGTQRPATATAATSPAYGQQFTAPSLKRVPLEFQSRTPLPPELARLAQPAWRFRGGKKHLKLAQAIRDAKSAKEVISLLEPEMNGFLLNRHHVTYALQTIAKTKDSITDEVRDHQVIADLVEEVIDMIATQNIVPDQVAKIFFAWVTLKDHIPEISELQPILLGAAEEHVPRMTAQHKQTMLKACAMGKLQRQDMDRFLPSLASGLVEQAEDFMEANIPNILWCAAKLQGRMAPKSAAAVKDLIEVFTSIVEVWLDEIEPSKLATIVWSIGKGQVNLDVAKPVLEQVVAKLGPLETVPPHSLGMICTGLAALQWAPEGFMARMSDAIVKAAPTWSSTVVEGQLPLFAWAFAKLGVKDKALLQFVADKSVAIVPELVEWRLCSLAWVYTEVCADTDFSQFQKTLKAELARREISEERMLEAELGFEAWLRKSESKQANSTEA